MQPESAIDLHIHWHSCGQHAHVHTARAAWIRGGCMARELWDSHVRARRSCVFRALHMMYAQAPGQLRASRTSTRGVEAFIFESGRSARIWYLGGGGGGDHESSRCLPSTQQAGSEPYQRGWAVGACARSEVAHRSAAHTSIPTRCKSVRPLCTNMDAPVQAEDLVARQSLRRGKVAPGIDPADAGGASMRPPPLWRSERLARCSLRPRTYENVRKTV